MSNVLDLWKNHQLPALVKFVIVLQFLATSFVFGQNAKQDVGFTVEGEIQDLRDCFLIGTITDPANSAIRLDTIVVKNGSFKHRGHIQEKQIVRYEATGDQFAKFRKLVKDGDTVLVDLSEDKSKSLEVVAFPGATIVVSGIAKAYLDAYPSGTEENEQLANLNRELYPMLNEIGNIKTSYNKKNYDSLSKKESELVAQIANSELAFINRHPSSIVAAYLVFEKFRTLNEREPGKADSLYHIIQPFGENFHHRQILALKEGRKKAKTEISIGDSFPSFKSKFVYEGTDFNLDQTRGKYTLIDFWGSWCVPCVREMPKLKEYYEKYKDKLNIVGVANDRYQNWKAFLDKNKYTWVQILDQDSPKLADMLNVKVYPTKFLLDPDGKVIMIFRDSNEQIWKALNDLFES